MNIQPRLFNFLIVPFVLLSMSAASATEGGQEGFAGGPSNVRVSTESLIKMNDSSLKLLLDDYITNQTEDGFSTFLFRDLVRSLIFDKGYVVQIIKRVNRHTSVSLRQTTLDAEITRINKRIRAVSDRADSKQFDQISRARKALLRNGLVEPSSVTEEQYVKLITELRGLTVIQAFIEQWYQEPLLGPTADASFEN